MQLNKIKRTLKEQWEPYKILKKPLLYIFLIYFLAIFAIIRANFNYIDDLGRAATGYRRWETFGRYASNFLSMFIHTDKYLADISPLTQILAVLIIAFASIIVLSTFSNQRKISWWNIIAVMPLGLSPYFVECLSYKYDSPYMALSVLVSVFPLLFVERDIRLYSFTSIVCTILMCISYQSSSGIYPLLVIFYCFGLWNSKKKDAFKILFISAANYLIGLGIFRIFIMKPVDTYVSTSMFPIKELIPGFFGNLYEYYRLVYNDLPTLWIVLIIIIAVCFVVTSVMKSSRPKYQSFLMSGLVLVLSILLAFGVYPALTAPLVAPRAMYGFGVLIAFMTVNISFSYKMYPAKIVCFMLSWCLLVFSFIYGNALSEQKRYNDFRVQMVIDDLNDSNAISENATKKIQLSGSIGNSPVIDNMLPYYPILDRIIPSTFSADHWGEYYFYNYFDLRNIERDTSIDLTTLDLPVIDDTIYHTIKGNDNYILIELK